MAKLLIGIVIGLIIGGLLTFYFFVGVPRASETPGAPIQPPDPGGVPPGTAQIVLRQDFFNEVLRTIFQEMNAPTFPLALGETLDPEVVRYGLVQADQGCQSAITVLPEGSGVQTGVRFDSGRILAPLAFSGSYNSPFGCMQFTGWAQANFELRFDPTQQMVFGRINVETVNIDGLNPLLSGLVTPLVQSSLNSRVNPIQMLQGQQIAINVPIAATNANLNAAVQDVRAEVKDNALNLYVIYDFAGKPTS